MKNSLYRYTRNPISQTIALATAAVIGGTSAPVEPATGSTRQAAIVSPPCRSQNRCKSSASSAPCSGWPRENRFSSIQVWRMCSTPGRPRPNISRFFNMPPIENPPKFTP